jgi:hypothetical protein
MCPKQKGYLIQYTYCDSTAVQVIFLCHDFDSLSDRRHFEKPKDYTLQTEKEITGNVRQNKLQ